MLALKVGLPLVCTVISLAIVKMVASRELLGPEDISKVLTRLGPVAPLVFVLALGVRPVTLLPGQAFTAMAGMLWGTFWGTTLSLVGSGLSAAVVLWLGGRLLRRPLARWSGENREALAEAARRNSFLYGAVVTLNPLLPTDVSLALGAGAGARLGRLAAGAIIGTIPGTLTTAMFGSALTDDRPWALALSIAGMVASLIGGALIARSVWRSIQRNRRDAADPEPKAMLAAANDAPPPPRFARPAPAAPPTEPLWPDEG